MSRDRDCRSLPAGKGSRQVFGLGFILTDPFPGAGPVEICPLVTHTAARQPRHLTGFPGQPSSWSPTRREWYATAMTVRHGNSELAIARNRSGPGTRRGTSGTYPGASADGGGRRRSCFDSRRAAASGSRASRMARTTATRKVPAAITAVMVSVAGRNVGQHCHALRVRVGHLDDRADRGPPPALSCQPHAGARTLPG